MTRDIYEPFFTLIPNVNIVMVPLKIMASVSFHNASYTPEPGVRCGYVLVLTFCVLFWWYS